MEQNLTGRKQLRRLRTMTVIGALSGLIIGMMMDLASHTPFIGVGMVVAGAGLMVGALVGAGIGALIE